MASALIDFGIFVQAKAFQRLNLMKIGFQPMPEWRYAAKADVSI